MKQCKKIGIYVHVPFCSQKCHYCDFYSIKYNIKSNLEKQYFAAVIKEIESYKNHVKRCNSLVDTIYFGGGTPSIVEPTNIKNVLNKIKKVFKCKNLEITMEVNPCYINEKDFKILKKAGVNRLSFGLQSANDDELYVLGRRHSSNEAKIIIELAKKIGFENISVDVMLGLPSQTIEKVKATLDFIKDLDVKHVSAYILKIEPNTVFNQQSIISKLPTEDAIADIYIYVVEELKKMGFNQYEISNFAKLGYECKHNLKYWNLEEYIGIGPAAHSFYNNKRYYLEKNIYKYIGMANSKNFKYIYSDCKNDINEYIMLKLRTNKGISIKDMELLYPKVLVDEFLNNVNKWYNKKYIYLDGQVISLTPYGFLIFNTIVTNIMVD